MRAPRFTPLYIALSAAFGNMPQAMADEEKTLTLSPVVVTATRQAQNSFDLPVAIDVVEQKNIKDGQLQMNLSESLIRVPGITAQNRTQQAQDPQISSRGFGSRSSFGVRGIRVYVDGIPLTMPDGQGQPGVVDLSSIKSIEVMRGPFSSLYGNSSGGVIQMFTQDAPATPTIGATTMFGSYDTKRNVLEAAGQLEGLEYSLNISNYESDGYRANSSSNKQMATAKFKFNLNEDTKVTTLVNWFDQEAQDPLGLDRARAFSNGTRDKVVPAALFANTSVKRDHTQVGFNIEHAFNENNKISFIPYVGTRNNAQILTTSALATGLIGSCTAANPPAGTCARLSQISREFYGADTRWDNKGILGVMPYSLSIGITYGKSSDSRLDRNILVNGVAANALNRDEDNISSNFDQYIQGKLSLTPTLDIHAGARHTKVKLEVKDNFITPGNPGQGDNSGSVEYQQTTPVIGAIWKATETLNFYANFGKGFETPTFIEAAFDNVSTGAASKPNLGLKASESNNTEIGLKSFLTDNTRFNLTLFHIKTKDEIVVNQTNAGRSSYTNANDTKRNGVELSLDSKFDNGISTFVSYTYLDAKFDSAYRNVRSGNKIPGTYKHQLYGEVAWQYQPLGFFSALEGRYNSDVFVNDINTDKAPSYTIFNIRAGLEQNLTNWRFKEFIRLENITDKDYIGSVRVNDGNGLFFEPAAGRNYLLGLSAQYKF
ncbi:TonB-dependent receptor family protein [Methylophilus sp. UBA6697]|uniref:TonB-dependent receptor family protein n=1 Tax=Methylophilus sp. UBA6697 TaxID=1946902 RepID=UPI0025D01912|nr:TonB-dependent receptor [Methylophilus sp. UBA6697]